MLPSFSFKTRWSAPVLFSALSLLSFKFQPGIALLLALTAGAFFLSRKDRAGGVWLFLYILFLIAISVNLLLLLGLAYVHKVISV